MLKKTSKPAKVKPVKAKPAKVTPKRAKVTTTKRSKPAAGVKPVNDGPVTITEVKPGKCVAAKLGHAVCQCEICAEGRRNP